MCPMRAHVWGHAGLDYFLSSPRSWPEGKKENYKDQRDPNTTQSYRPCRPPGERREPESG